MKITVYPDETNWYAFTECKCLDVIEEEEFSNFIQQSAKKDHTVLSIEELVDLYEAFLKRGLGNKYFT